ncbi:MULTISPECIES: sugar ABC transporter substrate-binding protein [unclassified Oceanispirochaeta]|uniref:ABC transporter substrate-binding protein n=1 Tax=unclassified Oceanispirochaeta TaxID=2635722 RepID=UPI000E09455A|nr:MULTISPECIES: sugar ABC transporter substrate-binding protein [unclassified Oceanispirochaeta]MBF9018642.1 sugar ABC transporter substrate-binding protein [Oceanispirochaeta sp. M2]NPD75079.1 sugar ABC transporter substrate-binding protein [Oceanispirochaeta sp. M1]RDG29066.1 sugar ABC transporter substrate-binding protein [Oceanispirochaeta sp. M1]
MKKIITLGILFTMAFSSLYASGEQDSKSEEKISITYAFWSADQEPAMEAIRDEFQKENPNIEVTFEITPWGEYWTKLEASAMGGAMPDVFWMHANRFANYVTNDVLMDLSKLNVDFNDYKDEILGLYAYKNGYYAVPKDFDVVGLFYNKDLFDNAGLTYPNESWTWDNLVSSAKILNNPEDGVFGFAAPDTNHQGYFSVIYQNEGSVLNREAGVSHMGDKATIEAVQFWRDFIEKHEVSPTQEQLADTDAQTLFTSGKVAMLFLGSWKLGGLSANEQIKDKFDVAVLPKGKTEATIMNGLGYSGSAATEHPEAVKAFISFLGSERAAVLQGEYGAAIPAFKGQETSWLQTFPQYNVSSFLEMAGYGIALPTSLSKSKWEPVMESYMRKAQAGQISIEKACQAIAEEMNVYLSQE